MAVTIYVSSRFDDMQNNPQAVFGEPFLEYFISFEETSAFDELA